MAKKTDPMSDYYEVLKLTLNRGVRKFNKRTGQITLSLHAPQVLRFNVENNKLPLVTARKVPNKFFRVEFQAFAAEGSADERRICELMHGTRDMSVETPWTKNARDPLWLPHARFDGDIGRLSYGPMMRTYPAIDGSTVDQLQRVVDTLKSDPTNRQDVVVVMFRADWKVGGKVYCALPPCHMVFKFYAYPDGRLSITVVMRSWDLAVGGPSNIAYYTLMLYTVAHLTGLTPYEVRFVAHDSHIYSDHVEGVEEMLRRYNSSAGLPPLPTLVLDNPPSNLNDFRATNFKIQGYDALQALSFEMF
jgi:thymidylate synthase